MRGFSCGIIPNVRDLVSVFTSSWNFTRGETLEILDSLNDAELRFKPQGDKWQTLYWEFGCLGRTQIVYTKAIETGIMDFSLFSSTSLPSQKDNKTKTSIKKFLEKSNSAWLEEIKEREKDESFLISWPGFKMPLVKHIASLAEHERLHHGQFISYFTLAGLELPPKFKSNWNL